ncbi:MAG: hypothetical protein WCV93_00220 [Candidatus Shapirobacteria bacterium]
MSNNFKFALLGGAIATIILSAISSSIFFYLRYRSLASVVPTPSIPPAMGPTSTIPEVSIIPSQQPQPSELIKIDNSDLGSATWLSFPKVAKLSVFRPNLPTDGVCYDPKTAKFHQTAEFSSGSKLYNMYINYLCGMATYQSLFRFIVDQSGGIRIYSPDGNYDNELLVLINPEVKAFTSQINGIVSPETVDLNIGTLFLPARNSSDITELQKNKPKLITDTEYGPIYATYLNYGKEYVQLKDVFYRQFNLKLKDNTITTYSYNPQIMGDDRLPDIKWNDGQKNSSLFTSGLRNTGGCGSEVGNVFTDENLPNRLTKAGTLSFINKTLDIYAFSSPDDPVIAHLYKTYLMDKTDQSSLSNADFFTKKTHFLFRDSLGDWQIYSNEDYRPQAECGKPVIYLYPKTDTTVTVKVGADITKSEPLYPQNGWTVLAHKNGQLDYQGQTYPSLFWEGLGHGLYPDISGRGFVVAKKDLIPTIVSHLSQLGLNQQETADFLEFWQSKLPTSAYTRLTWLTTVEMNQLAPLAVSPRPDTAIRVFLDFAPLEKPVDLVPQKLSAPARTGFTLVEWGGLLVK